MLETTIVLNVSLTRWVLRLLESESSKTLGKPSGQAEKKTLTVSIITGSRLKRKVQTTLLRLVDTHLQMSNKCLTFMKPVFAHHRSFKQMLHILTTHICLRLNVRWPWRPRRVISTGCRKLLPKTTGRRSYATAEHEKWINTFWNKMNISTCFCAFCPEVEETES